MDQEKKFIVLESDVGKRLDKFLSEKITEFSRQKISDTIEKHNVFVDSLAKKPSYKVLAGQTVKITIIKKKDELKPYPFEIRIIYEDDHVLVLEKPTGLVVHPPQYGYDQTLVNALLYKKKKLYAEQPLRPGIVHRLDKETSGVMVVAKTKVAYEGLVNQFKERAIQKEYRAICHGVIKKEFIRIDLGLTRDKRNRLKMKISMLDSKDASTEVRVVRRFENATYLSLKILTGRMHQIRVHLKFLGHPLLADKKYGVKDNHKDLFLHAYKLGFIHPATNKFMEFESPLPKRFSVFLSAGEKNA